MAETFGRDATDETVAVADGWGVVVRVDRGALVVADGLGRHRRSRTWPRAGRDLRRLVVVGRSGSISLEALRWCTDVGVAVLVIDDGEVRLASVPVRHDDARLRRAQAWAPFEPAGLAIIRRLLGDRLAGQAAVAADQLGNPRAAATIAGLAAGLNDAPTIEACRLIEAQAAAVYFGAWSNVRLHFARAELRRVRPGWLTAWAARSSALSSGSNRNATHPLAALLNYLSALAEAEAVLACHAVGLDPGLGILHYDTPGRASLALDLLEPVRVSFERHVLTMAAEHTFRVRDFAEMPDGRCRLLPPLTHELAALMPALAKVVAPVAEHVAATIGAAGERPLQPRSPLTKSRRRLNDPPAPRLPLGAIAAVCVDCGNRCGRRADRCSTCIGRHRRELAARASEAAAAAAARRRADGETAPGSDAAVRARAGRAIAAARARSRDEAAEAVGITWATYRDTILPALGAVRPTVIAAATGLSPSSASKIKAGRQIAQPKHWPALARLVGVAVSP